MIYVFKDTLTDQVIEVSLKLAELDTFKEQNPHMQRVITAPGISYSPGTRIKVDDGFREVISKGEERLNKKFFKSGKW